MKKNFKIILSIAAVLTFGLNADDKHKGHGKNPCKDDAAKLCAGVQKGGGKIWRCLNEKKSQVSKDCKVQLDKASAMMKKHGEKVKAACGSDAKKLCSKAPREKGGVFKCLKQNESKLSPSCKEAMSPPWKKNKGKDDDDDDSNDADQPDDD